MRLYSASMNGRGYVAYRGEAEPISPPPKTKAKKKPKPRKKGK